MKKTGKYREILIDVLKKQIQGLIDQLYEDVGVDSLLITTDGDIIDLGTGKGKMFLLERHDLSQDFSSFCLKASIENPLVKVEQDVYMTEPEKKQNDSPGSTFRDRKSSGNNLKEESNDEINMTGSEQMNITDWLSAVVDMPDGTKQCIICGYGTNYPSNLKRHLNVKHHIGERKASVQQFRCGYCHYNTTVKCNIKRHLRTVHAIPATSDNVEDHASVVILDNKQIDVPQGEDFDASTNDTITSDVEELKPDQNTRKSRKRQHTGDYVSVSGVTETEDGDLVDNDFEMKGKWQKSSPVMISAIECIYCHMCFADKGVLKQHIDEIHFGAGDSGFTCEHCSKRFRTEFSYRGHLASHINSFQCPCGCSFNSNWQVKKHTKHCKIAKDGLEMQKNSNDLNIVTDVKNNAVMTENSADHVLMVRLSSVKNTIDSSIKSEIGNEKDS